VCRKDTRGSGLDVGAGFCVNRKVASNCMEGNKLHNQLKVLACQEGLVQVVLSHSSANVNNSQGKMLAYIYIYTHIHIHKHKPIFC
jgi:hypothetical protein